MESVKSDDFFVYVLPISGGALVAHLALLCEVYEARILANHNKKAGYFSYAPHMALGSSGGNVSIFIAQASDWCSDRIYDNVKFARSELFLSKWIPDEYLIISDIPFAAINGTIYNSGCGARDMFNTIFTKSSIKRSELWLGTYDVKHKKAQFFCNKNQGESYVKEVFFNEEQALYYSMPLKFTDGDIDLLADVCIASATIPGTVPLKEINGLQYADGGVMYSSPLSVLNKEILRIVTGKERIPIIKSFQVEKKTQENEECVYYRHKHQTQKNLRLFYFFPYQPNGLVYNTQHTDLKFRIYLDSILNVSIMQDRNTGVELLNILSPEGLETESYNNIDTHRLAEIIHSMNLRKHSMICLFPHRNPSADISQINGSVIKNKIVDIRKAYGCQVWYSKNFV